MELLLFLGPVFGIFVLVFLVGVILRATKTVDQAHVGVTTVFGKYRRVIGPGLHFLIPVIEKLDRRIPVQNQTAQLQFAGITSDQAAVHFTSTIIFTVSDHDEHTIKQVAYKFISHNAFITALHSAVEASVREFVAKKRQAEVLGLRAEIVSHSKESLDDQLASWGYTLVDLTVNDITFDSEVMASMSRVVAAKNEQTAAEFEGQALYITRTKQAEADGAAVRIAAESEAEAAKLRGRGLANFRRELADGLAESANVLHKNALDPTLLVFTMWTETVRDAAKEGTGNVMFLDGGLENMESSMRRLQGLTMLGNMDDADAAKSAEEKSAEKSLQDRIETQVKKAQDNLGH